MEARSCRGEPLKAPVEKRRISVRPIWDIGKTDIFLKILLE